MDPAMVEEQMQRAAAVWPTPLRTVEGGGKIKGKSDIFDALKPAALVIVATEQPVAATLFAKGGHEERRIGSNAGVWPVKLAKTGAWRDTVTATYDKGPLFTVGAMARWWFLTSAHRDLVFDAAQRMIAERAERDGSAPLLHGFQDVGPDIDWAVFELEIGSIAERVGGAAARPLDDGQLLATLDAIAAEMDRARMTGRAARRFEDQLDTAAVKVWRRVQ
jgi:hypothetical protein